MPARCVVGGCSNVPNAEQEIALHFIPIVDDERPEAKKRRRQWVNFVRGEEKEVEPNEIFSCLFCTLWNRRFRSKI